MSEEWRSSAEVAWIIIIGVVAILSFFKILFFNYKKKTDPNDSFKKMILYTFLSIILIILFFGADNSIVMKILQIILIGFIVIIGFIILMNVFIFYLPFGLGVLSKPVFYLRDKISGNMF